jgi:hypothetical protein
VNLSDILIAGYGELLALKNISEYRLAPFLPHSVLVVLFQKLNDVFGLNFETINDSVPDLAYLIANKGDFLHYFS